MGDYTRKVKTALKESGCYFIRQGNGDHEIWHSPITNKNMPVDSSIKSKHTANAVMKQAGINRKF